MTGAYSDFQVLQFRGTPFDPFGIPSGPDRMNQLRQMAMGGFDPRLGAHPSAFDQYYTAYSMAMLSGQEHRENVVFGGKVILPPSALAELTQLDIESPWLFKLRNPNPAVPPKDTLPPEEASGSGTSTPADASSNSGGVRRRAAVRYTRESYAGVLEFIAEEGNVHLPAWQMRALGLNEGDRLRVTGTTLPKGRLVKIQPQTVDFLEISDPKAVLEQALRNYSALTPGDIIEFKYNCLTFEVLILKVEPQAPSIAITDTDLEVDFAPPKGYVEPPPRARAPPPTMASKLKIDTEASDTIAPDGTGGTGTALGSTNATLSFSGAGQTLSGRKPRKSKARDLEPAEPSVVRRTEQNIVTNDTLLEDKKIPKALELEFGRLFFGYPYIPPDEGQTSEPQEALQGESHITFSGAGQTLSGRPPKSHDASAPVNSDQASTSTHAGTSSAASAFGGQGQTLGGSRNSTKRSRAPQDLTHDDGSDRKRSPTYVVSDSE